MHMMRRGRRAVLLFAVLATCLGADGDAPDAGGWTTARRARRSGPSSDTSPGRAERREPARRSGPADATAWTAAGGRRSRSSGASPTGSRRRYRAKGVALPRRSVVAEIHWRDAEGRKVPLDQPTAAATSGARPGSPRPSFPATRGTDAQGWTEVSETYRAPSRATRAIVELHLRWAPEGEVRWRDVSLVEAAPPPAAHGPAGRPSTSCPRAARPRRTTAGCTSR